MITPDDGSPADDAAWAPRAARPEPDVTAELVAGYHDFVEVARGGDSVVYRARQDDLDRDVAVKVVLLNDPETTARFRRELAITVRLGRQHPNIVTVLATGTTRLGQPCLVMDFFELGSLHDRLTERGPLPLSDVVAAGVVIADALAFAHGQGVLHRDVKPQNVLVLPTSYVLADFGLARAIDAGHSASLERFSYRHASPQVLDGEPPTTADDIYSLGSTLFTLLDGRPPFAADDPDEDSALSYLRRARTDQPRELDADCVPPSLAAIVAKCLAKDPATRFADAAQLRAALAAVPTETRGWAPGTSGAGHPDLSVPAAAALPATEPAVETASDESPAGTPPSVIPPAVTPPTVTPPTVTRSADTRPAAADVPVPPQVAGSAAGSGARETPPVAAREVAPVAVSALAELDDRPTPVVVDPGATGLRPIEPPPAAPAGARRWPLWIAVLVVALVAGLVIGLRRGDHDHPSTRSTTTAATSPSSTPVSSSPAVPSSAAAVPTVAVPGGNGNVVREQAIAPAAVRAKRDGDRVVITFSDRSNGKASFVITDPEGGSPHSAPPGSPGITIGDQPAGRRCYVVTAIEAAGAKFLLGASARACTTS